MSFYYPSITEDQTVEPFELQVARGLIQGHRAITVFGYNPDVDSDEVTVWPHTGIITHPNTAIAIKVSSSNASDTSNGTGARTVVINGLDGNFDEISETVTLNGHTEVLTTKLFLRINSAYVATTGSSISALGDIYFGSGTVTLGVPATVYNLIKYDYNNTITAHYTIPAGYTGYLTQGNFSAGQSGGSSAVRGRLMTMDSTGIRRTAAIVTVNNGAVEYPFEYPIALPEKTDVEATASGASANNQASILFVLVLIKGSAVSSPGTPRI